MDWGGDGPVLLLLHPTGFCAGVFDPLARLLVADGLRVVGLDLRGHGASWAPPAEDSDAFRYDVIAAEAAAALDALGLPQVDVLGASMGGGVGILLDRLRPGLVRRLLLCEPIAMPLPETGSGGPGGDGSGGDGSGGARSGGGGPGPDHNPMSATARRRRRLWPSRAAMVTSYGRRPPLDELAPEALEAYVRWGTVERSDGQLELACAPEVEAAAFEAAASPGGAALAWEHLAHLQCPAVVLAGTRSNLPGELFVAQAARAGCGLVTVDGGHFFLQADTNRAHTLVLAQLERLA